ncbi:AzlD family protein [Curvivirga aplysinae]|uniref:AzlD family protein n=1 Tax=Curvivirga aplysinae TaxID=2529852 RepID=UPI0012BD0B1A|nr:AzlD domain-containing protein [Curvivirga aplysinae]MTI10679.1 AzlD domain-containing protein [Curvivirga aplysinae]
MSEQDIVIIGLALATFAIRIGGFYLGSRLPETGFWAASFNALPGCLIASLLAVMLVAGGTQEYIAAGLSLTIALTTRNLPLTMVAGILSIWALRHFEMFV